MPRKRKSETIESSGNLCAWYGCSQAGDFRAPLSRQQLHQYQWFCQEHIVQFNKSWNYFEGMTQDQIYDFQKDATIGHRPTWRVDEGQGTSTAQLEHAFNRMFGDGEYRSNVKPINPKDRDALAALDLEHPADKKTIKSHYRELVKKYHPDVNHTNARTEDTFKKITMAYHHLMAFYVKEHV